MGRWLDWYHSQFYVYVLRKFYQSVVENDCKKEVDDVLNRIQPQQPLSYGSLHVGNKPHTASYKAYYEYTVISQHLTSLI